MRSIRSNLILFLLTLSTSPAMPNSQTFLYFAYGSNLLSQRIHINNPTAVRCGVGKLEDFRLDFAVYSDRWKGAVATIVPTKDEVVWGALWRIEMSNLANLDRQEGVERKIYFGLNVIVQMEDGQMVKCRTYQLTECPTSVGDIKNLPEDRLPSVPYLKTIIFGAKESKLPAEYIGWLHKIRHNGYDGAVDVPGLKLDRNLE